MKHWTKRGARVSACGQVTDGIIRRGDVALLTQNAAEVTCELCKHAWDFPLPTPRRMPKAVSTISGDYGINIYWKRERL